MAKTLISTHTASASATLDITSGIDSTYPVYEFHFVNLHPSGSNPNFQFQVNATDGADFDDSPITGTYFDAFHRENGASAALGYSGNDADNDADFVTLANGVDHGGVGNDGSTSGIFTLYDPSSTTFVKHWIAQFDYTTDTPAVFVTHIAGYINDTTAIDEISFKFNSGNIDAGVIKMFGVS